MNGLPPGLSYAELMALVEQHGGSKRAAAKALGIARQSLQDRIRSAFAKVERGEQGRAPVLPGYAMRSISTQLGPDGELQKEWIKQAPEAGEVFEPPAGHTIKGISSLVDSKGRTLQQWIKTREDATTDILAVLRETFAEYDGHAPLIPAPALCDDDLLTAYFFPDVHFGMMSWKPETGDNYDLKIASQRTRGMASNLIAQSRPSGTALVLGLGDFFHMNDRTNMTPKSGHVLDVDGRWMKVLGAGVRLAMDLIEMAAQRHAKVIARFIPGNHDPDATAALNVALSIFYAGNDRIQIDESPGHHFYHRFGKVLIGATHGHTMKPDRMVLMLANDRPEDWGATVFRHFFFGHIHHESAKEIGSVRVESFNTIASKDAYAHAGGYRAGHALNAITFHKHQGEIGRHRVNYAPAMKENG